MPQAVPGWVTADGVIHTNHLVALKTDLTLVLSRMGENEVGAKRIAEKLTLESIDVITGYLAEIKEAMMNDMSFSVVRGKVSPKLTDNVPETTTTTGRQLVVVKS